MPQCFCGNQKNTFRSCFSSSTVGSRDLSQVTRLAHTFICWVIFHSTILYCETVSPAQHKAEGFARLTAKSPWDPSVSAPSAEFTGMCCHHGFLCEYWGSKFRSHDCSASALPIEPLFYPKRIDFIWALYFTKRQQGICGSSTYNRSFRCWDMPGRTAQALLFSGAVLNTSLFLSILTSTLPQLPHTGSSTKQYYQLHKKIYGQCKNNPTSFCKKSLCHDPHWATSAVYMTKMTFFYVCGLHDQMCGLHDQNEAVYMTKMCVFHDQNYFCLFTPNIRNWLPLFGWGLTSQSTPDCLSWKRIQKGTWKGETWNAGTWPLKLNQSFHHSHFITCEAVLKNPSLLLKMRLFRDPSLPGLMDKCYALCIIIPVEFYSLLAISSRGNGKVKIKNKAKGRGTLWVGSSNTVRLKSRRMEGLTQMKGVTWKAKIFKKKVNIMNQKGMEE